MPKDLVVIKIGGSILFNKENRINGALVSQLFKKISLYRGKKIIVLGCGEKLHDLTYSYNLTDTPDLDDSKGQSQRIRGFFDLYGKVNRNLDKVFSIISGTKPLCANPAMLFVKTSLGAKSRHEISWYDSSFFRKNDYCLTSGGVVLDKKILFAAISSDTIAAFLARELKAKQLLLVSDVDGVYGDSERKKLIPEFRLHASERSCLVGGMKDKLRRVNLAVLAGIKTQIVNGKYPERVAELLTTEKTRVFSQVYP